MKSQVHIFRDADELASKLAGHFVHYIHNLLETKPQVSIVLPGGKTPELFFRRLSSQNSVNSKRINWEFIHFFWSDERCVPSTHPESNYGMAYRALLRVVRIPEKNIHMIRGENDPAEEIKHYSEDIGKNVPFQNQLPNFDWIFLGLGEDGHTASIFPNQMNLLYSDRNCEVAIHPVTLQKRITLTGKLLLNADRVTFLVSGTSKKEVVKEIIKDHQNAKKYPAYFIKPVSGNLDWYLDADAARLI